MVKSLLKSPLTALFFGATLYYVSVFPIILNLYTETYAGKIAEFSMPLLGYIYMMVYGFFLSVVIAVIIANSKDKNIKPLLLAALTLLGTQWVVPFLQQYQFGEVTGSMVKMDILVTVAQGAVVTLLTLALAYLLFKHPPEKAQQLPHQPHVPQKQPDKYTVKKLSLALKMIILPLIYCVFYFLIWYFLFWTKEAVQVYYTGEPIGDLRFTSALVTMLLNDAKQIPMALIKGLLYAALLLPMLFQLVHKRVVFMITSVLILLGPAVQMLIPNPIMPQEIRIANLIRLAAEAVSYGALGSFLLHISMHKEPPPPPPAAPPPRSRAAAANPPDAAAPPDAAKKNAK